MGARPDAAVHHGEQDAAPTQARDHVVAADAGAIGLEEHQIGLRLLHFDAVKLRQPPCQRPGIAVILREPVDMVVKRTELKATLARLISLLRVKEVPVAA